MSDVEPTITKDAPAGEVKLPSFLRRHRLLVPLPARADLMVGAAAAIAVAWEWGVHGGEEETVAREVGVGTVFAPSLTRRCSVSGASPASSREDGASTSAYSWSAVTGKGPWG